MSHAGEYHGHPMLIGGGDHFIVANRPTGLDYGSNAGLSCVVDTVPEREESIGSHHRALHLQAGVLSIE